MSFWSAVSSLASLGSSALDAAGATGWLGYSSAKSLNKATAKQNAAISLDTSRELALNQHAWNVEGLRNAGLNPILAATNLGNTSLANVSGSGGSLASDPSVANPVSSALQVSNLEKQNDNLEKQNELLTAQKGHVEADIIKTLSDAKVNSARVSNINQDTFNKANTLGLTGPYAAANQAWNGAMALGSNAWSFLKNSFKRSASPFSNSAKDFSEGSKRLDKIPSVDKSYRPSAPKKSEIPLFLPF